MAEIRYQNSYGVLGAILDTGSGSEVITGLFNAVPGFATLTGSDYIKLVLDGSAVAGLPNPNYEIVYLTAYTSGSRNGTILRGQEGTTPVAHSAGTSTWGNNPTVADFAGTWNPITITSVTPPTTYTARPSDLVFANDQNGGITIHLPTGMSLGAVVAVLESVGPDTGVTVATTDGSLIGGNAGSTSYRLTQIGGLGAIVVAWDGTNWDIQSTEPSVLPGDSPTFADLTISSGGTLLMQDSTFQMVGPFWPDIIGAVGDQTISAAGQPMIIATASGITITLPQMPTNSQDLSYWIKNRGGGSITLSSAIAAAVIAAGQPPTQPLTVVASSNDTFKFTPISTGIPETFTVAPGTYATAAFLASAMSNATGTMSDQFNSHCVVSESAGYIVCTSQTVGTSDNGDTLTSGPTDILAGLGFTSGQAFAGGGFAKIDGANTLTLPDKAGVFVTWNGRDTGDWCLMLSHGLG